MWNGRRYARTKCLALANWTATAPMCEASRTAGQGQGQAQVQNGQVPAPELHSLFAHHFSPFSGGVDLDCMIRHFQ